MEGSTPGLLPYEGKVLCDEAESCCLRNSNSLHNRDLAGVEIISIAPDYPQTLMGLIHTLVHISTKLFNIASMIAQ